MGRGAEAGARGLSEYVQMAITKHYRDNIDHNGLETEGILSWAWVLRHAIHMWITDEDPNEYVVKDTFKWLGGKSDAKIMARCGQCLSDFVSPPNKFSSHCKNPGCVKGIQFRIFPTDDETLDTFKARITSARVFIAEKKEFEPYHATPHDDEKPRAKLIWKKEKVDCNWRPESHRDLLYYFGAVVSHISHDNVRRGIEKTPCIRGWSEVRLSAIVMWVRHSKPSDDEVKVTFKAICNETFPAKCAFQSLHVAGSRCTNFQCAQRDGRQGFWVLQKSSKYFDALFLFQAQVGVARDHVAGKGDVFHVSV